MTNYELLDDELYIGDLINDERIPIKVVIDTESGMVGFLEEIPDAQDEQYIVLPTADELVDSDIVIADYVDNFDIPKYQSAYSFLKETKMIADFFVYKKEVAIEALIKWMQKEQICLKNISIKKQILDLLLSDCEPYINEDEIDELVLEHDNIRILIGSAYKLVAERKLREVESYEFAQPGKIIEIKITI